MQVFVANKGLAGGVFGDVASRPQGYQIGGEDSLACFVEAAEGYLRWAEVFAEELDCACGVGGQVEVDGDEFGLDVGEVLGEPFADFSFVASQNGRSDARRGRDVGGHNFEHGS